MELTDLIGEHRLSGVDFGSRPTTQSWQDHDARTITFVLNGTAYRATEDPNDGYRSCMNDIERVENVVVNVFPPQRVIGGLRAGDNRIVDFIDGETGLVVLSVGTGDVSDYYPWFCATFDPRGMACNKAALVGAR